VLSALIFLPAVAALVLALPGVRDQAARAIALGASLVTFALSLFLLIQFKGETYHLQFREYAPWAPQFGINYRVGVDGLSIWLFPLTALLTSAGLVFSRYVTDRVKLFLALVLLLETAVLGAFASLDLLLFFTFFELTLLPTYFLTSLWGGPGRRQAATKFLIFTFAGSIFMLVGIIAMAVAYQRVAGRPSFSIVELQVLAADGRLWAGALPMATAVFWCFAVALLIKAGTFPFHGWISDFYAESPILGPILSCVMVKLGSFGFLRIVGPLLPEAAQTQAATIGALACLAILFGAALACAQTDLRRMAAYSTVSHMGFVLLGIFSFTHTGMVGGVFGQLAHGISAGALFILMGYLLVRKGTTDLAAFGGLKARMPVFAFFFMVAMLAGLGLPGTNGFVGEFLALLGAWQAGSAGLNGWGPGLAAASAAGVIIAAVYMLRMYMQVFYGPVTDPVNARLRDIHPQEALLAGGFAVLILLGGLFPTLFTRNTEPSIHANRQMVLGAAGRRPNWVSLENEFPVSGEQAGAWIRIAGRTRDQVGRAEPRGDIISPANLHPGLESAAAPEIPAGNAVRFD
jgi:NADH-quinone oxidoreductase subunit M